MILLNISLNGSHFGQYICRNFIFQDFFLRKVPGTHILFIVLIDSFTNDTHNIKKLLTLTA